MAYELVDDKERGPTLTAPMPTLKLVRRYVPVEIPITMIYPIRNQNER